MKAIHTVLRIIIVCGLVWLAYTRYKVYQIDKQAQQEHDQAVIDEITIEEQRDAVTKTFQDFNANQRRAYQESLKKHDSTQPIGPCQWGQKRSLNGDVMQSYSCSDDGVHIKQHGFIVQYERYRPEFYAYNNVKGGKDFSKEQEARSWVEQK